MTIHQYYKHSAATSLNGSLLFLIPPGLMLGISLWLNIQLPILALVAPFLLLSFFSYQKHLLLEEQSRSSAFTFNDEPQQGKHALNEDQLLLTFLPAPSLRMLLFNPDGILAGEIKDLRFWKWRWLLPYFLDKSIPAQYGFYNGNNQLAAIIKLKKKEIIVTDSDQTEMVRIKRNSLKSFHIDMNGEKINIHLTGSTAFTDIRYVWTDRTPEVILRKGWMPLEWSKQFKDPNTPVLTFHSKDSQKKRLAMFSLLTLYYRYSNH
ncbi:hypothetical protein CVD25_06970 [Bacillus canaveralius]|uniref:Uncharacterized protein n=1 Tax=Bacillus canaveralius TaxID=1403243 RepID=A0A2N5GIX6_9BACI|nr:hypothetical protein [Bacillus canaveralius]PLR81012.1 hypothetical protein CU635_15980 [Bacillus canaveralius]PLR99012.1 hypothetical protein CVD25_06970 [Bacillus canaveralius]